MDTATSSTGAEPLIQWRDVIARLDRLRRSLMWGVVALIGGTIVAWGVSDRLYDFLARPLTEALRAAGRDSRLVFTHLTDPFIAYLSVSIAAGLVLALPVLMTILWRIIAPIGLHHRLAQATTFVGLATILFVAGAAFGHQILLPFVIKYLLAVAEQFEYAVTIREYLRFSMRLLIAMGLSAQLPLISWVLARFGLVTGRRLLRWFPYAVLIAFSLAALITPPDGISQVLVAVPMLVLYLISVLIAALANPRRADP